MPRRGVDSMGRDGGMALELRVAQRATKSAHRSRWKVSMAWLRLECAWNVFACRQASASHSRQRFLCATARTGSGPRLDLHPFLEKTRTVLSTLPFTILVFAASVGADASARAGISTGAVSGLWTDAAVAAASAFSVSPASTFGRSLFRQGGRGSLRNAQSLLRCRAPVCVGGGL